MPKRDKADRTQRDWLKGAWRFLLVLDAARPDYVRQLDRRFEEVDALGGITHTWCANLWQLVPKRMTYFSANPVTAWKQQRVKAPHVEMIDVWRHCWRRFGKWKVGSVHPADLNAFVLDWLKAHEMPKRVVVHYLQPHAPYIVKGLPVQCGNLHDGPTGKKGDLSVVDAIERGLMTWDDLREAYMANLKLVLATALELCGELREHGEVIITADHGEVLGEKGLFGHARMPAGLIRRVPLWSTAWEDKP